MGASLESTLTPRRYYEDGANPPEAIAAKFLKACEAEKGGVAVHCKAGLGRTGTNIGNYMMKHYRCVRARSKRKQDRAAAAPPSFVLTERAKRAQRWRVLLRRKRASEGARAKQAHVLLWWILARPSTATGSLSSLKDGVSFYGGSGLARGHERSKHTSFCGGNWLDLLRRQARSEYRESGSGVPATSFFCARLARSTHR